MGIFSKLFWKINANSRDVKYYLNEIFVQEGYSLSCEFLGHEYHMIYSKDKIEFDLWWEVGNRPYLSLKNNGENIATTIFESLLKKHCSKMKTIGAQTYYIYHKLDKDNYYGEHRSFILNYLKNN